MHPAALAGFRRNLREVPGAIPGNPGRSALRVLDLGGQDVNGTVHDVIRDLVGQHVELQVLDIEPGPGVTIVADARNTQWWSTDDFYDLVVSTEMLEHVKDWDLTIRTAAAVLRDGGWFVGTCASLGRAPHGATGAPAPAPGEHYRNVNPDALVAELDRYGFDTIHVQYERDPDQWTTCDLYWRARRAAS